MSSCAATNCKNRSDRAVVRGRSFHRLPLRDPALLKVWLSQMGRESWKPRPSSAICSDHFEKICFDRTGQTTRIRESAVPTLFNLPRVPFKPKKTKTTKQKKEIVIKFPPKKLRSGKQLAAPAPGVRAGSPHDHDYLGKGGFLNQEQLKSQSQHGDMNDPLKKLRSGKQLAAPAPGVRAGSSHDHDYLGKGGSLNKKTGRPGRGKQLADVDSRTDASSDRQSSDQDLLICEEPIAGNAEGQLPVSESQANALINLKNPKQDGILKEDKTKVNKEKQLPDKDSQIRTLPDGNSYIKDGFFYRGKPSPISDISRNERKRINRIKQHDHSYSVGDNHVVLKHRMDVACTKLAEIRAKFKCHHQKNRRLSVKIKALTRKVQELRDGQFAINNTLKFLESLEYRPNFGT
eukprot:XP_782462.1 PREDICTED: THAP domain-containing protein 4 [Strongylocentrotus purpuratus]